MGHPEGDSQEPPQYTLKNEGIPRKAGDALWNVVSPSTSSEHGVWVTSLGVQVLGVWLRLPSTPNGSMAVPVV